MATDKDIERLLSQKEQISKSNFCENYAQFLKDWEKFKQATNTEKTGEDEKRTVHARYVQSC